MDFAKVYEGCVNSVSPTDNFLEKGVSLEAREPSGKIVELQIGRFFMDWSLFLNKNQKMAERHLDLLEERTEGRPVSRFLARAHALDLQDEFHVRGIKVSQEMADNRLSGVKPYNRALGRWFDAK